MLPARTGSKRLIREINEAIVLQAVRSHELISRSEIARLTGLSAPTVSGITALLLESGLLYERATGSSTGGRPPVLLSLNPQAGYVVGAKLTERRVVAVLTDLEATVVERNETPIDDHAPEEVAAAVTAAVEALTPAAAGRPIHGVALGLAGVVDRDRGVVRHATYFDWHDLRFADIVEARVGLPVIADNDVNVLVAAERLFGAGQGIDDLLVVSVGRGVGLGMVLGGRLYRGSTGGAGEFGHVKLASDGPPCACGASGCLEALVSDPALAARATATLGRTVDTQEAVELAQAGDPSMRSLFADAGGVLGSAIALLVNVLNPQRIILGGEGARAGDVLVEPLIAALQQQCFDGLYDDVDVVVETWDDEGWARGAAGLLVGELFEPALTRRDEARPSLATRSAG